MQTDGPKYGNPVVLATRTPIGGYTQLLSTLPEYRYQNRIVGFTDDAVFACTSRVAKSGYYEMICEPIEWKDVKKVRYGRYFSLASLLLGVGLIVLGVAFIDAGWVSQTHTGLVMLWMPFLAPIAGVAFIVGSKRLRLVVEADGRRLWWVAPPLFNDEEPLRARLQAIPQVKVSLDK